MSTDKRSNVILVNRCFVMRNDGHQLIIKRSSADLNNPGKWEVPGGKVDEGQDLTQALEREVTEETGLCVQLTHQLIFVDSFIIEEGRYKGSPYVVLFSVARLASGNFILSEEHTEYAWVPYNEMLSYDLTNEVRKAAITLKSKLIME